MKKHHHTQNRAGFPMGRLVITANAGGKLDPDEVDNALNRHRDGDWGNIGAADTLANTEALLRGGRLFSAYEDSYGNRFYIITEADRSATTVLLPEDY